MLQNVLNWISPGCTIEIKTQDGTMLSTTTLPRGGFTVVKRPNRDEIIRQKYNNLIGTPITVTNAAEKYGVHRNTILFWIKNDYITVLRGGYRSIIDEADIAYCADVHHQRRQSGSLSGAPLLDNDGLPYELKHPELSRKRKQKPAD